MTENERENIIDEMFNPMGETQRLNDRYYRSIDRIRVLWEAMHEAVDMLHQHVERMPRNALGNSFERSKVDYFYTVLWQDIKNMPPDARKKIKDDRKAYDKARKNCVWLPIHMREPQ